MIRTLRDLAWQVTALALLAFLFTLRAADVSGVSMEPTLPPHAWLLISTLDYRWHAPHRGDVIAFAHDQLGPSMYVKRVIAVPGDRVAIVDGHAWVDGRDVDPPTGRIFDHSSSAPMLVQAGRYFVLGDDRPHSEDSRSFGTVPMTAIAGRAAAVLRPLQRMRLLR